MLNLLFPLWSYLKGFFSSCWRLSAILISCDYLQGKPRKNDLLPPVGQERAIPQLWRWGPAPQKRHRLAWLVFSDIKHDRFKVFFSCLSFSLIGGNLKVQHFNFNQYVMWLWFLLVLCLFSFILKTLIHIYSTVFELLSKVEVLSQTRLRCS